MNRFEEARIAYERSLDWARKGRKDAELARTLNNLGMLHRDQNRQQEARKEYEEALKISRELARKNSETNLPYLAQTLNNLGTLNSKQNRTEEARKEFEEALKTYSELEQKNPGTYLHELRTTQDNVFKLAVLERDQAEEAEMRRR